MKLPMVIVGILVGAVLGTVGLVIYPLLGLLPPLLGICTGACVGGIAGIFTLKRSVLNCRQDAKAKPAMCLLTAYFGVLAAAVSGGILGLIATFWALAILYGRINGFQLPTGIIIGAFLGGVPAAIYVRRCTKLLKEIRYAKYLGSLPENAGNLIKAIIGKMRYKKEVRNDVMAELTAHFEDELKDCKTDEEKEQKAQRLITYFGNVKLLAVLLRRAKKRCRPLWRTVVARTFQTIGVLILCFIIYCVYISLGKPTININYIEEATRFARPVADESLNAAPIYQKAIDAYKEPPLVEPKTETEKSLLGAIKDKVWVAELTKEELALMKQWLSDNADASKFFKQASEKPHCWWKRESKDNFVMTVPLPELPPLGNIAGMMVWQAKLKAYNGHIEEAFDDLLACYQAGRHFKGPRSLIEQLVGMAVQALSTQNVLVILTNQKVDSQLLRNLQTRFEELTAEDTYTISYEVERFCGLDFIQRCYTDNGRGAGHMIPGRVQEFMYTAEGTGEAFLSPAFLGSLAMSIASADRRQVSREFKKLYTTAQEWAYKTPWQLHKENVDLEMGLANWSTFKKTRYWPVFLFATASGAVSKVAYRHKAQVEALITTLATIRFKQSTGDYPENLKELVTTGYLKKIPLDPFSDKPLVYKKTDDNFILYSVGLNFEDDDGQVYRDEKGKPQLWHDEFGDAVFWPVQK